MICVREALPRVTASSTEDGRVPVRGDEETHSESFRGFNRFLGWKEITVSVAEEGAGRLILAVIKKWSEREISETERLEISRPLVMSRSRVCPRV